MPNLAYFWLIPRDPQPSLFTLPNLHDHRAYIAFVFLWAPVYLRSTWTRILASSLARRLRQIIVRASPGGQSWGRCDQPVVDRFKDALRYLRSSS